MTEMPLLAPRKNLRRVMPSVMAATLAVQFFSFFSSAALAHVLGASRETDAYFLGLSVPVMCFGILLMALRSGAIPALTELQDAKRAAFSRACSELVSFVTVAATLIAAAATALTLVAVPLATGGDGRLTHLTRLAVLELAPLGVLGAVTGTLTAILAVRGVFATAMLATIFEPIVKLVFVVVGGHAMGTQSLMVGGIAGSACSVLVLWALLRRQGVTVRLTSVTPSPFIRSVVAVSGPMIVGGTVLQVNPVVDRAMAAGLGAGSITTLDLGLRLFFAPATLVAAAVVAPVTATWAARNVSDGWPAVRASVQRATSMVLMAIPPLAVLGLVLRRQLVTLVYQGGAYGPHALQQTTDVFGALLIGLPAQVMIVLLAALFVVRKNTLFPMKVALANVVLNVALNLLLRPFLGVAGVALSTSLTLTILLAAYVIAAQRAWHVYVRVEIARPLLRATAVVAVVGLGAQPLLAVLPGPATRLSALVAVVVVTALAGLVQLLVWRPASMSISAVIRSLRRPAGAGA